MRKEDIPILYEDTACFVINKPADLTVHPASSTQEQTLIDILREPYPEACLVHRLDKGTTGCLLVAKSDADCEALQSQFKDRTVKKQYLAICAGVPEKKKATIDAPVGRNLLNRTKMSLFRTGTSREAQTTYEVLAQTDECSLLRCEIHTGRTHQIRVHLSAIGHPIVGDEKYGSEASKKLSEKIDISSPLLHAHTLEFTSLETGERVRVEAPVPEKFQEAVEELRLTLNTQS